MLRQATSIIETAGNPVIKYGGESSSETLQKISNNLKADLLQLNTRIDQVESSVYLSNAIFIAQSTALGAKIQTLQDSIDALSSGVATEYKTAIADMYTTKCRVAALDGVSTSADINLTYGQATLHITNTQEKLVTDDANGNVWIPDSAKVGYCYTTSSATAPNDYEYTHDDSFYYALDRRQDTAWVQQTDTATDVWIHVKVPTEIFTDALANALVLHPFPALTHTLVSAEYRTMGDTWRSCDLTYFPGYSGGVVQSFGNSRIFFPTADVYELRIRVRLANTEPPIFWGFSSIELKMIDFSATSKLTLDYSPLIGATAAADYNNPVYTLVGKDPAALAFLSKNTSDLAVEIGLTQQMAGSSPVITAVTAVWSTT